MISSPFTLLLCLVVGLVLMSVVILVILRAQTRNDSLRARIKNVLKPHQRLGIGTVLPATYRRWAGDSRRRIGLEDGQIVWL